MKTIRLAAFLLAACVAAAAPAFAQLFGTSQVLDSHVSGGVISNNPVVHASGNNVYVAWTRTTTQSDIMVRTSTDNGTTFGAAVNVSNGGGHPNIEPVIVGDGANVHVFWTDDVAGDVNGVDSIGNVYYARSTNNGATFSAPTVLVHAIGYSRPTAALISSTPGQVHLVFYDNRPVTGASIAGRVFHKMSCDNGATWGAETNVTQFDGDVDNEQPRIAQLSTGEIFISLRSSRSGIPQGGWPPFGIFLLRMNAASCPAATATFVYPAQRLSQSSDVDLGGNYGANIFTGANGGLHAAWWNDTNGTNLQYRYGKPNGAGFGAQQDMSLFGVNHPQWAHMTERTGYGIGEDATGQVHAIFLQNGSSRGIFQTGSLWYRCTPAAGTAFVGKQLLGGAALASEPRAFYSNGRFHVVWQDYRNTSIDQSEIFYNFVNTATACVAPPPGTAPVPSTSTVDFGGNSMQTTSLTQTFQITNSGGASISIGTMTPSAGFSVVSTDCSTLASGASCNVVVSFTPTSQGTVNGTLSVAYSGGATGTMTVNLTGVGEKSLVTHYYNAILNRAPDAAGKTFWESEATRMVSLGADINETWFVMAGYFFNSAEYLSAGKSDALFVTDLYNTFFNRAPDSGGLNYWVSQIQGGLPREVVLFSFMFSPEFQTFTQGIFGNTAARPEINVVMDFFRGILNRLPDTPSFKYWVNQLRTAQCSGAGPVYTAVDNISAAFIFNPEYNNRARNNTQFVTDMYYSFLRRGGDAAGVQFWVNKLNAGQMDINTVRKNFLNSPEFGTRVNAVISAGCAPQIP